VDVTISKKKRLSANEHPWNYGLISGSLFAVLLYGILLLERPNRAIMPLLILAAVTGLIYAVVLAQLHGKWRPTRHGRRKG